MQPATTTSCGTTEGGDAAALAPPIESLNDDTTEPIEPEFVDFPHRGEINPTGQKRLVRTVCEPNLETPTEDAANADRAPSRFARRQRRAYRAYVHQGYTAHDYRTGSKASSRQCFEALASERTDERPDTPTDRAHISCALPRNTSTDYDYKSHATDYCHLM